MRKFYHLFFITLFVPTIASAQYTVNEKANVNAKIDTAIIRIPNDINIDIKNDAYYHYMKCKRRHERNFFETKNSIYVTQYAFNNWASGGENNFNGRVSTQTQHVYHVDKLAIDTYLNATYGLGQSDKKIVKIDDNFQLNSDISYVLYNKWNYTFGINLASQFSKTYVTPSDKDSGYKSNFFAPANLKPYFGFTFKVADNQKITLAPVSGNVLMVFDKQLSDEGAFGVDKGKRTKLSVGAYLNCQWTQNIIKNDIFRYRTILQSFCDYRSIPNVNWENWFDFKVFKLFSINLYVRLVYDDKVTVINKNDAGESVESKSHLQIKESLGFGISYNFKNKEKPKYKIIK